LKGRLLTIPAFCFCFLIQKRLSIHNIDEGILSSYAQQERGL
jgi:hypothetical protein